MSEQDDDRLLESLGKALAPPPAEPSDAELGALRRAVADRFAAPPDRSLGAWWSRNRRRYGGRRAVFALVAAVALTTTGTAVAVSAGTGFTAPLRRIARAVGLPVESPAMARAKEAMGRLRKALIARNAGEVRKGAADVQERVDALEPGERASVSAEKEALLGEADRLLKALAAKVEKRKKKIRPPAPEGIDVEGAEDEPEPPEEAPLFEEDDDEGHDEAEEEDHSGKRHEFEWRGPAPHAMGDDHDDDDDAGDHDDAGHDDHDDDEHDDDEHDDDKEERKEHP